MDLDFNIYFNKYLQNLKFLYDNQQWEHSEWFRLYDCNTFCRKIIIRSTANFSVNLVS